MRVVKLSRSVRGFSTTDQCVTYFEHVLPWQGLRFQIEGKGGHVAAGTLVEGEILVFSYGRDIVAVARTQSLRLTRTAESRPYSS